MAEEEKQEAKKEKNDFICKLRKNPWIVSSAVLAIVLVVVLIFRGGGVSGNVVSADEAAQNLISFINAQGGSAEVVSAKQQGMLYQVVIKYNGQDMPVYMTLDGETIVPQAIPVTGNAVSDSADEANAQEDAPQEIPKTDKPKVELFIMTHCPYGLQAEKGIIPAITALGAKIDAKIRFVHYFMHGDQEEQETYRQLCIREEQSALYLNYLNCFSVEGDADKCITKAVVNKQKLAQCLNSTKPAEYYAEDSALSKQYGVQGSPTLVINGVQSGAGRSPASYLSGICSAFNNAPATECGKSLSSASPSPGFGASASASAGASGAAGGCASA